MEALSAALVLKALDGLNTRFLHITQNIANAGTPGYQPARVSFEDSLRAASTQGPEAIKDVTPTISYGRGSNGTDTEMRLDLEIANASQTASRYSTLIEFLGRHYSLQRLVIRGGQ